MHRAWISLLAVLALPACQIENGNESEAAQRGTPSTAAVAFAAHDLPEGEALKQDMADDIARPLMQTQVVLDRLGFTPGVVDGKPGLSTRNALIGFQEANGLGASGEMDERTTAALSRWNNIPATRMVTIPPDFAAGPFAELPKNPADQAKLPMLGYASLDEKLAERFHTTVATLQMLNQPQGSASAAFSASAAPSASAADSSSPATSSTQSTSGSPAPSLFRAGQQIRVPNVGGDQVDAAAVKDAGWLKTLEMLGVGSEQPKAEKIVVSKSNGTLRVYDSDDKLVGLYTATMGSQRDPLPLGEWKILGIAYNPKFTYNPKLFWDVPDSTDKQLLPPGPNGPVGVVWIDLSKEHYGIHGTPNPETIGRAQSHGCVRLTNWDVARLAQMVSTVTQVLFEA